MIPSSLQGMDSLTILDVYATALIVLLFSVGGEQKIVQAENCYL